MRKKKIKIRENEKIKSKRQQCCFLDTYIIWCLNVGIDLRTINQIREALYTITERDSFPD